MSWRLEDTSVDERCLWINSTCGSRPPSEEILPACSLAAIASTAWMATAEPNSHSQKQNILREASQLFFWNWVEEEDDAEGSRDVAFQPDINPAGMIKQLHLVRTAADTRMNLLSSLERLWFSHGCRTMSHDNNKKLSCLSLALEEMNDGKSIVLCLGAVNLTGLNLGLSGFCPSRCASVWSLELQWAFFFACLTLGFKNQGQSHLRSCEQRIWRFVQLRPKDFAPPLGPASVCHVEA